MAINSFMAGTLTGAFFAAAVPPATITNVNLGGPQLGYQERSAAPSDATDTAIPSECKLSEPNWVLALSENARQVAGLQEGWDGLGSIPVSQRALFTATSLVRNALYGLTEASAPHLVSGGDGSVQIEWHRKHGELELDVDAQGRASIWVRDHRNDAEYDAEDEAALAMFYRWAPWIAANFVNGINATAQANMSSIAIAA